MTGTDWGWAAVGSDDFYCEYETREEAIRAGFSALDAEGARPTEILVAEFNDDGPLRQGPFDMQAIMGAYVERDGDGKVVSTDPPEGLADRLHAALMETLEGVLAEFGIRWSSVTAEVEVVDRAEYRRLDATE